MSNNYQDNETLLKSLAQRDFLAFTHLYKQSRQRLFIIAYSILQDVEAAQDIVQDFFADFIEHSAFENIISLQGYMAFAVKNRAINYKKREARYVEIRHMLTHALNFSSPASTNEELKEELKLAIGNLPPMAAKVFNMHYLEELNYNDISAQLGISKSTVSSHMNRALKGLRADLKKDHK